MANLMLTTACNFTCDYCFGKEMIGPGHAQQTMSWDLFLDILDWIDRGSIPELDVHLMGGEPTLSPLFNDMIGELIRRKRRIVVFSNLCVPMDTTVLADSSRLGIRWTINVNDPSSYRGRQIQTLQEHLALLGSAAVVTLNITSPSTEFDHVLSYIEDFGLARCLKVGVTLPTLDHVNAYVKREDYPGIAVRIMALNDAAGNKGIEVEFECGVPYCLFTAEQHKRFGGLRVSHCGSRLDITPTGNVINCLPLCRVVAIPYSDFADYRQAREWFRRALMPYASFGGTSACPTCEHLVQGRCMACLAHAMWNLDHIALPPLPQSGGRATGRTCKAADCGREL